MIAKYTYEWTCNTKNILYLFCIRIGGEILNKRKLSLMICACACVLLAVVVLVIAFTYNRPKHDHALGEEKTYHIYADQIKCTQRYADGCQVELDTEMSLTELLMGATKTDRLVLEEDIMLTERLNINAFINSVDPQQDPQLLNLNINLDLNGFTLSADIDPIDGDLESVDRFKNNSMFKFNANRGSLNLTVSNGKLVSQNALCIFVFENHSVSEKINVTLDNVQCEVSGIKATPLFMGACENIEFNAINSRFISRTTGTQSGDYGVGAFIDSEGEFDFKNCYFEGGDALYVRGGTVGLDSCELVNVGLADHSVQGVEAVFYAVGSCLTADSHTTADGRRTFEITIKDCEMISNHSSKMISIKESISEIGLEGGIDSDSVINIESCKFDDDPMIEAVSQYDNIKYPNGIPQNDGTQTWVCGNTDISAN